MREAYPGGCADAATRPEVGDAAAFGATDWLHLGAAPTFAVMALLAWVLGGGRPDILCSGAEHASPLGGMTAMYLLISGRGNGTRRACASRYSDLPGSSTLP